MTESILFLEPMDQSCEMMPVDNPLPNLDVVFPTAYSHRRMSLKTGGEGTGSGVSFPVMFGCPRPTSGRQVEAANCRSFSGSEQEFVEVVD